MSDGRVVLRCGQAEHQLVLSTRDIHLLDGRYFAPLGASMYRPLFGLDFVEGLGAPPLNQVLKTHRRSAFLSLLEGLLVALNDQKDLFSFHYQYRFTGQGGSEGGGGTSGFRVRGLFGFVSVEPSGYCDLTLLELAPTGRGRVVEIVDMRTRKELDTDDWGVLKISRRAAPVSWYDQLPSAIGWLKGQDARDVEVLHG